MDRQSAHLSLRSAQNALLENTAKELELRRADRVSHQISPKQVLVIGDERNDKKSLEISGVVSVAMGNAPQEVKDVARYVTKDVKDEGFAYAVDKLVKKPR